MKADNKPYSSPGLSLWEKIDLFPALLSILTSTLYASVTGLFRGKNGTRTYRLHIFRQLVHKGILRLSFRQTQYLAPPTNKSYENWSISQKVQPVTISLNHGAFGHWVGKKNAKKVVIYYHGGGFALPGTPEHFAFCTQLLNFLNTTGDNIAFFFLTYTLTPNAVYPTQLAQAVDALRYILTTRKPSDVFLGGDSAGGNLAFSVLTHITHPHSEIERLSLTDDEEDASLAGVFGIAPWVSFRTDWPTIKTNHYSDIISAANTDKWSSAYLDARNGEGDPWSEPLQVPAEWWRDVRAKALMITAGGDEILLSSIEAFVDKVRSSKTEVEFVVGDRETHAPMIYGGETGTQQGGAIEKWLADRISS
ncbi:hypothetical protein SI65_07664 [Aspergillus cristatus]|uniref:Alpha/beta hydrolase fold-3 domain-containing protein n=1 Tax=Aspergillus cristatus TaxID=573508 RepID=A0A1E3B6Z1_ASPCR|nr:hypothetical protein SI65_07664 [Aspergillus cristatus]